MGCAQFGDGNGGSTADDGHAHRFHSRRGAAIWRLVCLLPCAKLWRHGYHIYAATELCRAGQLLSFALRRNHGALALVVSKELLPLLHVWGIGDLSRAGIRSIL